VGKPIRIAVLTDNDQANRGLEETARKASRLGSGLRSLVAPTVAVAGGLALFGKASVESASAAQQSLGATETVYRRFSDEVIRRSNRAAQAIGLSANEYRELSNVVGASLAGAGLPIKRVTDLTGDLNKRAADMAATFGGTTREAIESISSALRGETDPIERYGVSLKQSDVSARLAAQGLDDLTGEALKQAEMQARLDLLFQKTKTSQGAFRRESNTLAGQQQRLGASFENLKAKIGTNFLPVLTQLTAKLNRDVVPPLAAAADKYLPRFSAALAGMFQGGGSSSSGLDRVKDSLAGIDWDKAADGAESIWKSLRTIGGAVGAVGLDALASGVKVTGTVLEFAADHADTLAAALPFLAAGFVAIKVAQAAANLAMAAAIPLRFAEMAATRQQTVAIRAMTAAIQQLTAAQAGAGRGAWVNGQWYSAVRANRAAADQATTSVTRMGRAAAVAGGVAGLGGLAFGLQQASQEGMTFGNTMVNAASGAGIGAMFGPIGALIGAGAGIGLTALVGAFADTKDEAKTTRLELLRTEGFENAKRTADDLREALIGVKNAYGETVRASIEASFSKDGKQASDIARLREMGVSTSTLVSATLGQADAQRLVEDAFRRSAAAQEEALPELKRQYDNAKDGAVDLVTATGQVIKNGQQIPSDVVAGYRKEYEDAEAAVRETAAMQDAFTQRTRDAGYAIFESQQRVAEYADKLGITAREYRRFPKAVRTDFEANGLRQTAGDALRLFEQYKGLRRFDRIRAVISAPGVDLTRRQVRDLARQYNLTPKQLRTLLRVEGIAKTKSDLTGYQQSFKRGMSLVEGDATKGARRVSDNLRDGTRKAKSDLGPFRTTVRTGADSAKTEASAGGRSIGVSLSEGVVYGAASRSEIVRGAIAAQVRSAIAAGKAAARSKSPSRETFDLGVDLGRGLELGVAARTSQAKKRGRDLIGAALAGVTEGTRGTERALERLTRLIEKRIDLKDADKEAKREREVLRSLREQYAALNRNARLQDRIGEQLKTQVDRAKGLREQYAAQVESIRAGVLAGASITSLGEGTGYTNATGMLAILEAKVKEAEAYTATIDKLRKAKLDPVVLQQLIDAGASAGSGAANALLAGGQAAIDTYNDLVDRLKKTGTALGTPVADQMYAAMIASADKMVARLTSRQKQLDRVAERMADALAAQVRKELKLEPAKPNKRETGGATNVNVRVDVGPGGDPVAVGKAVQKALDAYYRSGGRAGA
jgi:hypothetical protein